MPTTNALDLTAQGVPYYNGIGTFTAPTITNHGVIVGDASNAIKSVSVMTNGQLLIGSTGADPVPASITPGTGISISGGAGTLTVAVNGGGLGWQNQTTNITLVVNQGYFVTSGALSLLLPATSSQGDQIKVALRGGTSWTITQAAGQSIMFVSSTTTVGVGGSLASTAQGDFVTLRCHTANTGWIVEASMGNISVV